MPTDSAFQEFSGSFTVPIIEDSLSDFLASLTVPNMSERQVREFALKFEQSIMTKKAQAPAFRHGEHQYEQQKLKYSWDDYKKHPRRYMPAGSEGSLQRLLWINPDGYCLAQYTVTVFGDLRDYDDYEAIHKWFDEVCDRCYIRQAVCHCDVSG